MLKLGVLGSAAAAVPFERIAAAKGGVSRIAESKLPRSFTVPFAVPPVMAPVRRSATTDYYSIDMLAADVEILPGLRTTIFGYDGMTPGPTIKATRGRDVVVRFANYLPARQVASAKVVCGRPGDGRGVAV